MIHDDALLIREVRDGNTEAFRGLVDRHGRRVFQLAYRLTGNSADADEVVQETFLRAYKKLSSFEKRARFSTWLYRIATNCALDFKRREKPVVPIDGETQALPARLPGPQRLALSSEIGAQLSATLDRLSTKERSAFVLRHCEGMSIREIGQTLDLAPSATKNTIFRAVRKLREALAPLRRSA